MARRLMVLMALGLGVGYVGTAFALPLLSESRSEITLSDFDRAMTDGHEALAKNKLTEARRQFQRAAKIDPKSMLPWLGLADVAKALGDDSGIASALDRALVVAPDRPEPVVAKARWLYSRKSFDDAEVLLRQAVKMDPKSPTPLVDLGDLYAGVRRDPNRAMDYYKEAVRVDPRHAGAHFALGSLMLMQKDALGAILPLQRAQELAGGGNPFPSLALGQALFATRKWPDARNAFTRAIDIQPGLVDAYVGRASSFIELGQTDKALEDLRKAESLAPKNAEIPFRIGMLAQQGGGFDEAYRAYGRAIRIQPKFALAYNNLAWLAVTRGERLDEALQWIERARALAPGQAEFFDTHGWLLRARGDREGAARILRAGIDRTPSPDLYYHLGVVLMELGKSNEARDNLRRALQLKPDFSQAKDCRSRLNSLETTAISQ